MNPALQDTLLQLFEHVRLDPDSFPTVPVDEWDEGSIEWQLLTSFSSMMEQVHQRTLQFRKMEHQLREREEQYRSVFEATGDGLFVIDLDGVIVEANPAAYRQLGYTYEEIIGLHRSTIVNPEYHSLVPEYLRVIQMGDQFQGRAIDVRKDGTTFPVEVLGRAFTYKGRPHTLSVVRDITKQIQAEEQLREREEQYRSIFEAVTDSLTIARQEDGQIVEANPAACKMLGYSYEELIGKFPADLVPPDFLPLVAVGLQEIQVGERNDPPPMVALRKDGSSVLVEAHSTQFTYKEKPHHLTVSRNITERVQAEEQLREREEQYRNVFEATSDGLIIADLNGVIIEANPAACSIYGYTYEELLGLSPTTLTHPDSLAQVTEDIRTIKGGSQVQTRPIGLHKDGSAFYAEVHGTPFTYKGQPLALAIVRDITAQVWAEQQLREKEEQYRSIFESTYDAVNILNLEGFFVEVNPAYCNMFGYRREELIGKHASITTAPEALPLLDDALQTFKAGKSDQTVGQSLRKDGTTFYVEAHGSTLTYQGKSHTLGIIRDITERVEAEQQLREREEQYRSVFEATDDGLVIQDLEGSFIEVSPAFCRMLGYTHEELIGLHYSQVTYPEYYPVVEENTQRVQAEGRAQAQGFARRKDGSSLPVEAHSTSFTYKGKPHVLGVMRDITERVEAERQLREREEQYRSIFEATNDAVFIMNPEDGHIVEANPAACNMYSYSYEEFIGLLPSAFIHPDQLPTFKEEAFPLIRTGGKRHIQGVNLRKDGSEFPIDLHQTVFTYQGEPHILSVIRDITEQVQAQQLLEQRVEERTRELASLLEISHTVASTLQLKPLLGLILDQLKTVVDYTSAAILTVAGDDIVLLDSRSPTPEEQLRQIRFLPQRLGPIWEMITSGQSIRLADMRDESPLAQTLRVGMGELMDTTFSYVRASLFVPLTLKELSIGMLVLTSSEAGAFTPHHTTLAQAIANQAAIAIENARLYEQAQELAAVEERQRLARELHDSVSQALYGISLGVHTARMQLDRDPRDLAESLDYVLELAEAALVEMRALIFELRPESLETEGLVTALTKQAAALQARQNIEVDTDLCAEPDLPLKVKQDLYRIAQEALHNTVKHARASKIELRMQQTREAVTLEVCDNGRGFDATASFPGHLGLHSMQERVIGLGGELQIESIPGQGTSIRVRVPAR